jgi:Pvc16 N-terminal domain
MIQDVDESLRGLIRREALDGTDVEVVLDAPTREWSARRNAPTLDLYLYDIREDLRRRENGLIDVVADDGRVTQRVKPPRWYKLSYLVTAWTQRPEDEHRLLAAVLACFASHDHLPEDTLAGQLAGRSLLVPVTVALPPPEDRALSDVWSALGGELKPSLDLVVISPFETGQFQVAAPEVREGLRLRFGGDDHPASGRRGGRRASPESPDEEERETAARQRHRAGLVGAPAESERPAHPDETVVAGPPGRPGRTLHLHNLAEREPTERDGR